MRVSDFLHDLRRKRRILRWLSKPTLAAGDMSGGASEGSKMSCFVPFAKSCCKNEEEMDDKEEEEENVPAMVASMDGDREKKPEALSFNLGMGAGLFFLLAKSANEFNKMVELRSEMEVMIKYIKGEIQRKSAASSNLQESMVHSFPNSNYVGSECSNKRQYLHDDTESCNFSMATHKQSNWNMDFNTKMCSKGNEMEQELQVELQRLQLNLEDQDSSMHPHQDGLEVDSKSNESFSDDAHQQVNEPSKAETSKQTGICPRQLESRLHELLETRQQERIVELETALECAGKKLSEREMEICWWRDTARLVSKHREERFQLQF